MGQCSRYGFPWTPQTFVAIKQLERPLKERSRLQPPAERYFWRKSPFIFARKPVSSADVDMSAFRSSVAN